MNFKKEKLFSLKISVLFIILLVNFATCLQATQHFKSDSKSTDENDEFNLKFLQKFLRQGETLAQQSQNENLKRSKSELKVDAKPKSSSDDNNHKKYYYIGGAVLIILLIILVLIIFCCCSCCSCCTCCTCSSCCENKKSRRPKETNHHHHQVIVAPPQSIQAPPAELQVDSLRRLSHSLQEPSTLPQVVIQRQLSPVEVHNENQRDYYPQASDGRSQYIPSHVQQDPPPYTSNTDPYGNYKRPVIETHQEVVPQRIPNPYGKTYASDHVRNEIGMPIEKPGSSLPKHELYNNDGRNMEHKISSIESEILSLESNLSRLKNMTKDIDQEFHKDHNVVNSDDPRIKRKEIHHHQELIQPTTYNSSQKHYNDQDPLKSYNDHHLRQNVPSWEYNSSEREQPKQPRVYNNENKSLYPKEMQQELSNRFINNNANAENRETKANKYPEEIKPQRELSVPDPDYLVQEKERPPVPPKPQVKLREFRGPYGIEDLDDMNDPLTIAMRNRSRQRLPIDYNEAE